jgi:hypothetical protein
MLTGLATSAAALAAAPLVMAPTYSVLAHTTSESAAQGVPWAGIARTGFVVFGLTVVAIAVQAAARWGRPATALHGAFGTCLVLTAVFATRSWQPEVPFDARADLLHSVFATAMGFAFAFGVAAVALHQARMAAGTGSRPGLVARDVVAVTASVVVPLSMLAAPDVAGALQRVMFAVAYGWYVAEILRQRPPGRSPDLSRCAPLARSLHASPARPRASASRSPRRSRRR